MIIDILAFLPGLCTWEQNKTFYFFKLARLLRLKRFVAFFKHLRTFLLGIFINNNKHKLVIINVTGLLKLMFIYYFICHLFACSWLYLGVYKATDNTTEGWLNVFGLADTGITD
jgi:hypothetical protein